jgi:hypothetical protein
MPGHTNSALAAYPELNCDGVAPPLYTGIEVGFSVLCVDSDITYRFIDDGAVRQLLVNDLLPLVQYFAYVEITRREHQALWREYQKLVDTWPERMAQRQIMEVSDIYPVFRDLFRKKVEAA